MQITSNLVSLQRTQGQKEMGLSLGVSNGATRPEDQRSEQRQTTGERLFVQITQASDKALVGKTMACRAIDASAHGIKFLADDFIPVSCLIDLWVDDKARPGKFFLSGDVRWTQKAGKASTVVGVRLKEGLATDIEGWKSSHSM